MAVDYGIVNKSGAWFTYDGEQLGQGRENAKNFLSAHPEIMVDVTERVMVASGLRGDDSEDAFTDADDAPIEID
jgi:recombination protein RecA